MFEVVTLPSALSSGRDAKNSTYVVQICILSIRAINVRKQKMMPDCQGNALGGIIHEGNVPWS